MFKRPVTSEELALAAPDFRGKRFSQASHKIDPANRAAIERLINGRC